jgi:hypothetical protein
MRRRAPSILLLLAVLACGGGGSGGGGDAPGDLLGGGADAGSARGDIRTAEGLRLRFPPGFAPRAEDREDGTVYLAVREREVVAADVREAAAMDCAAAARQVATERFVTAGGFDACALPISTADGTSLAVVLVEVQGLTVTVAAAASAPARATELARAVADGVGAGANVKPVPGKTGMRTVDPRLVGCWRHESDYDWPPPFWGEPTFGSYLHRRCFAADGTFTSEELDLISTPSGMVERSVSGEGEWFVASGSLVLTTEGGEQREALEWQGEMLLLDGLTWARVGDP